MAKDIQKRILVVAIKNLLKIKLRQKASLLIRHKVNYLFCDDLTIIGGSIPNEGKLEEEYDGVNNVAKASGETLKANLRIHPKWLIGLF